jgi:RNA polymerase sigma-B factor
MILSLRFGDELTQAEIADRIGVSQMHVCRLLKRILATLREGLLAEAEASS